MKTVILYYTLGGATKKEAERLATETGADLCQIFERRKRGLLGAFIPGCPMAMKRKASAITPPDLDLAQYDRIIIGCPIWAGHPAPAFNAIVQLLPPGKEVELFFCSTTGEEKDPSGTTALITERNCIVVSRRDVKTGKPPKRASKIPA